MKEKPKMYVIRKYIKANNVACALRLEKKSPVHEVFIDEKWQDRGLADAIGFGAEVPSEEE